jgi:hypothetical protein
MRCENKPLLQDDPGFLQEITSIAVEVGLSHTISSRSRFFDHTGSLYSMTDPFLMLMLIKNLGKDYIVWDKSASIRFKKPGRGTVSAKFRLSEQQIHEIKQALKTQEKIERVFRVEVMDESGSVIAEVEKPLHVRRKESKC